MAETQRCPICGGGKFSSKPVPNAQSAMPVGALRCEKCQTLWNSEDIDLNGDRYEYLEHELHKPKE